MGLIKAAVQAVGSAFADQWLEYFYCDAIPNDVLVVKGQKRTKGNNKGSDNVITAGSGLAVADGQCMIIVDQGRIVEICAEPGQYTYDTSSEPSIFCGGLGKGVIETFKTIGRRIATGGDTGNDQRVYYFNTKELIDNKFGTQNAIPFRVVDTKIGLDVDITVRCNGVYSYRITDPILFYANVCGNIQHSYKRSELDNQLRMEFMSALQPGFAKISEMGIRYSALPGHTIELCDAMNAVLSPKWAELRGISIVSIAINSITAPPEDENMIKELQRSASMGNTAVAAGTMVSAQADAMRAAASNAGGAMMGFMGMNMAQQAGGLNAQSLVQMNAQQQAAQQQVAAAAAADTWTCKCGTSNTGKFCTECAAPKSAASGWQCVCGAMNQGKFCAECGKPGPAEAFRCDKCGWKPADPTKLPKFCPECGDPFNEADKA